MIWDQIEGRNVVLERLKAKRVIERIYIDKNAKKSKKINEIIQISKENKIPVLFVPREKIIQKSVTGVHMGVIADIPFRKRNTTIKEMINYCCTNNENPFILILNEILYEQNFGAIIRSADCAGVHAIITPHGKGVTPEVARISSGGSEYVPVIQEGVYSAISTLKRNGIFIIGVDMDGDKKFYESNLRGPVAFVLGGENKGLTDNLKKRCDLIIRIPMMGHITSLNISVSAAIIMFEKVRQEDIHSSNDKLS